MITRVQLGTSRLENLPPSVLKCYLDKRWLHLGDPPPDVLSMLQRLRITLSQRSPAFIARRLLQQVLRRFSPAAENRLPAAQLYSLTNFEPFYFSKGDRLPLGDTSISYIYSEHMFEHLFFDDAIALLRECYRVLKPN